jgi:hypothetical protein
MFYQHTNTHLPWELISESTNLGVFHHLKKLVNRNVFFASSINWYNQIDLPTGYDSYLT